VRASWLTLIAALAVACDDGMGAAGPADGGSTSDGGTGAGQVPPGASASVPVSVPASMRGPPFDVPRTLQVPPGFAISVHARVPGARFIAATPEGSLLVSNPGAGKVSLVRPGTGGGDAVVTDWVTGLTKPHDLVFHGIGGTLWLYVSESNGVRRYAWSGAVTAPAGEVVVAGLPDSSTPELHGVYGHELKNIALDGQDRLFVSIASSCNVCASDARADPVRGAIHLYDAAGGNHRLYARGLRNAEGLAFFPGTDDLWVAVNNRDELPYPFQDATGQYGRIIPSYVDDHPPDELIRLRDGGNYGWPFCNPNPDGPGGLFDMPFDRDYDTNRDGSAADCGAMDRVTMGIQAHAAALGLTFLQGTAFPAPWSSGAAIALHGSWNSTTPVGDKVVLVPFVTGGQQPSPPVDLVTGWTGSDGKYWGRPVDVAVDPGGGLLISDDASGTIYRLFRAP
jgi:glucose/arabinose dehydrogenase